MVFNPYTAPRLLRSVLRLWRKQCCAEKRRDVRDSQLRPGISRSQSHHRAIHLRLRTNASRPTGNRISARWVCTSTLR